MDNFIQINDYYVQYLIDNNYKEIIAYYLFHLTPHLQIQRYSSFLQTITDNKERILLLNLAKERNINVQAITLNIVENLNKTCMPSSSEYSFSTSRLGNLTRTNDTMLSIQRTLVSSSQQLNEEDKSKINAIDWIIYDKTQRLKLLEYANFTMRYFLLERQNFEATKQVFAKLPKDTLAVILTEFNFNQSQMSINFDSNLQNFIENLPHSAANVIKEYLCFKEYIEAINFYTEWFEYFHKEKPAKPATKQSHESQDSHEKTFAERMNQEYEMKQYEDQLSRWMSKALLHSEKVRLKFFSILKFPMGGWMCDFSDSDRLDETDDMEEEEQQSESMNIDDSKSDTTSGNMNAQARLNQLHELRKFYLPNVCFILVDMLSKMNQHKELIRLSDLIASEMYKLYALFDKTQLRLLLNKIANSSISLLDSNSDYLGYN